MQIRTPIAKKTTLFSRTLNSIYEWVNIKEEKWANPQITHIFCILNSWTERGIFHYFKKEENTAREISLTIKIVRKNTVNFYRLGSKYCILVGPRWKWRVIIFYQKTISYAPHTHTHTHTRRLFLAFSRHAASLEFSRTFATTTIFVENSGLLSSFI